MEEKFPKKSVTSTLWEPIIPEATELFGADVVGAITGSERNFGVAPGDVLFYSRQKTSHLAVITEVKGLTATFVEAVGTEFNRVGIYAPAGGIMVNERVVDLSTGEVTGMLPGEILGWGVYRVSQ